VSRRAVFIDRDGVINELVPDPRSGVLESPLTTGEVRLIDGAAAALSRLAAAGRLLVGVSNQPAAAKGALSLAELRAVQARILDLLSADGVRFDDFRLCLHHPDGVVAELRGVCDCRKPAPGMLLEAASALDIDLKASWMIGDTDADVLAGRAAGCRTVLVRNPGSAHKRGGEVSPDAVVGDLAGAVAEILRCEE
jgi:D-glycero-D-manno-heptose 1,7-bisphosphate phosphatase